MSFMAAFINMILFLGCSLSFTAMRNRKDISLVSLKFHPFLTVVKREINSSFMIWARNKSGNPIERCGNPADQQGAEARREHSQIS